MNKLVPKILIVDDNPLNIKVLSNTLTEYQQYDVLTANTGERAILIAERALPQLILLDINMPGIDGYETCRRLKQNAKTSSIPIIFLSALDDTESKVKGFQVGGIDYITKPFQKEEVISRVQAQLRIFELTTHLEKKNHELTEYAEELKATMNQLEETNRLLLDSINYAQRIQSSIIPGLTKLREFFPESFVLHLPRNIVSGDFYYLHQIQNRKYIIAADCTGHGVPGAFMSLIGILLLDKIFSELRKPTPALVLETLNFHLQKILKSKDLQLYDGMDIIVVSWEENIRQLQMASSMRPMLLCQNRELQIIPGEKISIGWGLFNAREFQNYQIKLSDGDSFYLFSDGYPDQFGGVQNKKYNTRRFYNLIKETSVYSIEEQSNKIYSELLEWKGNTEQTDDILIIGIRV
ncbi:MAG: response regulator [Bacteroidia bacterium]|nr:response regulator [Bacteroidia bacterium]